MAETQQAGAPIPPLSRPSYAGTGQSNLMAVMDWLVQTPSIPLSMRQQFYALWETTIFGNFDEYDIKLLRSNFRLYLIEMLWFIPEQKWGNLQAFKNDTQEKDAITIDLSMLCTMLDSLYYTQLTRGKEGFTVKEMTTNRSKQDVEVTQNNANKGGWKFL